MGMRCFGDWNLSKEYKESVFCFSFGQLSSSLELILSLDIESYEEGIFSAY